MIPASWRGPRSPVAIKRAVQTPGGHRPPLQTRATAETSFPSRKIHSQGRNPFSRTRLHSLARIFIFPREKNSSSQNFARRGKFRVKKIFARRPPRARFAFSEEKSRHAGFFSRAPTRRNAPTGMSTQKVTENYQIPPLMSLTGYNPISISCGQGSGHPHPVVVDNVSGSFGNLMSPEAFCRL